MEIDPSQVRSMLKLFCDIFSNMESANYFYTNDLKVVVDVLILESTNLPEDDEVFLIYFIMGFYN